MVPVPSRTDGRRQSYGNLSFSTFAKIQKSITRLLVGGSTWIRAHWIAVCISKRNRTCWPILHGPVGAGAENEKKAKKRLSQAIILTKFTSFVAANCHRV